MADLTAQHGADYHALRHGAGWWWRTRDVLVMEGRDAVAFLQGQLSQDVAGMAAGTSIPAFVLQPEGKVAAWVRVTRLTDESFALDVDEGYGPVVAARLRRFLLRMKVEFRELWGAEALQCLSVRGPGAADLAVETDGEVFVAATVGVDLPGRDVFVASSAAVRDDEAMPVHPAAYAAARIEAGLPAMGAELTEKTIPAEVGPWIIADSVSFTKGCYTGQELVARIDSRGGNVPRHLRGLVIETDLAGIPGAGAEIVIDDKVVGSLTSVAWSPGFNRPVALAYVGRAVEPPAEALVRWNGGTAAAHIESLPLTPPEA